MKAFKAFGALALAGMIGGTSSVAFASQGTVAIEALTLIEESAPAKVEMVSNGHHGGHQGHHQGHHGHNGNHQGHHQGHHGNYHNSHNPHYPSYYPYAPHKKHFGTQRSSTGTQQSVPSPKVTLVSLN